MQRLLTLLGPTSLLPGRDLVDEAPVGAVERSSGLRVARALLELPEGEAEELLLHLVRELQLARRGLARGDLVDQVLALAAEALLELLDRRRERGERAQAEVLVHLGDQDRRSFFGGRGLGKRSTSMSLPSSSYA